MAFALGMVAACAAAGAARADADEDEQEPSILDSVAALKDIAEARDALAERGFRFSGFYFSDVRGNLTGGMRRGATYSGLLKLGVDVDAEKVAGIEGGRLHADMLQIHGRDLSDEYIGNVLSVNDIGARPTTRLFELWYEQKFGDRLALKVGQLAADEEFIKSDYGEAFLDATFGWAGPPSENLPFGGPAYPLAALGAQATVEASENLTLVAAIYNGAAANPDAEDPEKANRHGLNFRLKDPPLVIAEARYRYNQGEDAAWLPGTLKLGGYGHFGHFDDVKWGTDGLVLGSPGSNGDPRRHSGDVNFYALLDQQIYRAPGDDPEKGVGVFARVIAGPKDRNEIDVYLDGGIVASGMIPGRPDDLFGFALAYANFSPRLADADRAADPGGPARKFEAVFEATYKAQIVPGLTVRPTYQYVMRPGGGVDNPERAGSQKIRDAHVFGVTTLVTF